MNKRWIFRGHDSGNFLNLSEQLQIDPVVSQLLWARGICEPNAAKLFLESRFSDLRDPTSLPGIAVASQRIRLAVEKGEPITIYGDYDADGMCATAILYNLLKLLRANVSYYVPNRLEDAYGLKIGRAHV